MQQVRSLSSNSYMKLYEDIPQTFSNFGISYTVGAPWLAIQASTQMPEDDPRKFISKGVPRTANVRT